MIVCIIEHDSFSGDGHLMTDSPRANCVTGTALTVIVDERCTINHMRGTNAAFADRSTSSTPHRTETLR